MPDVTMEKPAAWLSRRPDHVKALSWSDIDRVCLITCGRLQRLTIHGDHFLFSGRVLAGPHGNEVIAKQTCGRRREIRVSDGVHLTYDGGRIYGQQIAHDLTADLGILTTPQPC